MTKEVKRWESEDGQLFITETEALEADARHEIRTNVYKLAEKAGFTHIDSGMIADFVSANMFDFNQFLSVVTYLNDPLNDI